jgi:alanine-glyoxylate transaminase/serine-glyoxylate transaminase/serine-pyruvate transaminase
MLRQILYAEKEGNQPFLIAGSGTMGWDAVGANLIERGDEALVLNTGYFGDAFADWYVICLLSDVDGWWRLQRVRCS